MTGRDSRAVAHAPAVTDRESHVLMRALDVVRARQRTVDIMWGTAAGVIAGIVVLLVAHAVRHVPLWLVLSTAALAPLGALINVMRQRRDAGDAALIVERRFPQLQNLVRTSWELMTGKVTATGDMQALVLSQASRRVAAVDARLAVPTSRALRWTGGALLLWLVLALLSTGAGTQVRDRVVTSIARTTGLAALRVEMEVQPPAYTGLAAARLVDPERVTALHGSTVTIVVSTSAPAQLIHDTDTLSFTSEGQVRRASTRIVRDGFMVLRTFDDSGNEQSRRLIGVTATADAPPVARITAPGRDLFLTSVTNDVDVALEASDDLALRSLTLRYTRVSGSGERFTFTDGDVPVAISRTGPRTWTARGRLPLNQLALERGDMVVYRAIASDARPGSAPVESDAFIVEVVGIGGDAAEGFSIDPDQDRYAVSQQMVVLKTERLVARRTGMDSSALLDASRELSMEQRRVRAEFVFMMGGELAEEITEENSMDDLDESHEAENESDLSAGRMANQGRSALLAAIRAMSRAATALNVAQLDRALVHERTAVRELERAFSRTRYLLRAFTERERLDLTRRQTGNLADAQSSRRAAIDARVDEQRVQLQSVLQQLAQRGDTIAPGSLGVAAERVLAVDAASAELQRIAAQLTRAARLDARNASRRTTIDSATVALVTMLRGDAMGAVSRAADGNVGQRVIGGALRDTRLRALQR